MRVVRAAVPALLVALVASWAGSAYAGILVHRDPVGDMARSPVGTSAYVPAPNQVHGDITATRVVHARHAIWVQIRLRELDTTGNGNFHVVSIRTPWRTRTVEVDAFPGHWEGRASVTDAHGRAVDCAVTHRIDYVRNRVMMRVPRTCLGTPRWIQVAIRSTVAGTLQVYTDDARSTGLGPALRYGGKIPVG
jgi:hypothetical protein